MKMQEKKIILVGYEYFSLLKNFRYFGNRYEGYVEILGYSNVEMFFLRSFEVYW